MANVSNFIPLNRSLQNNWIWNDKEPFDKRSAWIDLIMLANFETKKTPYKGEVIECKRGDVNLSILHLAARWRWSREKTRRFLRMLESDNMIQINATTHRTTITLVNYGVYNDYQPTNKTTDETTDDTTSVQPTRQQADTTNNINNINKGNKENKCASALAPIYEDFCSKLAGYYPAERFDKDDAFPLWLEKVEGADEPKEKSKIICQCILEFVRKNLQEEGNEGKFIPKLSNVLGKDYARIVEIHLNPDAVFEKGGKKNTGGFDFEKWIYNRFCEKMKPLYPSDKFDPDLDEWKARVVKIKSDSFDVSSDILGYAICDYLKDKNGEVPKLSCLLSDAGYESIEEYVEKATVFIVAKRESEKTKKIVSGI